MKFYAGLDVGGKKTAACVVDETGRIVWQGMAAHQATQNDPILNVSIAALLEALVSIDAQLGKLDAELKELARRNEVAWRLTSIPGVGPLTAMAFIAAIEDVRRFSNTRDIGAYLGLTPKRYPSGDTDVRLGISKQGDDMARQHLYEAANSMLTTVEKRFGLRSWGLQLMKTHGPKKARAAVAQARRDDGADVEGRHALRGDARHGIAQGAAGNMIGTVTEQEARQ